MPCRDDASATNIPIPYVTKLSRFYANDASVADVFDTAHQVGAKMESTASIGNTLARRGMR